MARILNKAGRSRPGLAALVAAVAAMAALATGPLAAIAGENGEFTWSWDNTLSYGLLWRISNPDEDLIGLAAGGHAYSVNGDDGNQNYGKGIASNAIKWSSELQLGYKNFGAFARAFAFYDYENKEKERERTPLSGEAMDRVGSRAEIRDAFVWAKFHLGKQPGEVRLGRQVMWRRDREVWIR